MLQILVQFIFHFVTVTGASHFNIFLQKKRDGKEKRRWLRLRAALRERLYANVVYYSV